VRLCEVFNLIGGTSTGAIIATGLALGYTADELTRYYLNLVPRIFRASPWRILGWQAKFDARRLEAELAQIIGTRTLDSPDLLTGLCVITKRLDTGSPWILSNNPRARYWNDPADGAYIGNRHFSLANIVRASAAAPHYFDPASIPIVGTAEPGLFVDGAVTPYNNPALLLILLATLPQHRIVWPLGADALTLVSIGTGSYRPTLNRLQARRYRAIGLAIASLSGTIADNQMLTLGLTQALGRTRTPWIIDSEVGTMADLPIPGGPLFETLRYDVRLERDWLCNELSRDLPQATVERLRRLDDPGTVHDLYALARDAATRQVQADHLAPLFRLLREAAPSKAVTTPEQK
jgi:hypothetical protein